MTLVFTSNPMTFDNLFRYFHITVICFNNFDWEYKNGIGLRDD